MARSLNPADRALPRVLLFSVVVATLVTTLASHADADAEYRYCGRASYGRGAGVPLSTCNAGQELDGALCYPNCNSGYDGVGPVCWEICPGGYADDGAFCRRDPIIVSQGSYGRGAGTIPDACTGGKQQIGALCYDHCPAGWNADGFACTQPCAAGYTDDGLTCRRGPHSYWDCGSCDPGYRDDGCVCTRDLHVYSQPRFERSPSALTGCSGGKQNQNGLCYTPCAGGYTGDGPVCWQNCPNGYVDDGATCRYPGHIFAKASYGRGAGEPMVCASGLERDGALCYDQCAAGYDGVGPVCWEDCPSDFPTSCGIGCAISSGDCAGGTLSPVPGPSCTEPVTATACNGSAALCDRRFDEVTFAMTHNAHAVLGTGQGIGAAAATNQTRAVYQQLRDGVRAMMIDVGSHDGEIWLCHGGCGISRFGRLADFLVTLRRFLEVNPSETLTLLFEHTDGVTSEQIAEVFESTGVAPRAYVKPSCARWPFLSELGGRIVVFSQDASSGAIVRRAWGQAFDNPYSYDIIDGFPLPYACTVGRGTQSGLFILNHFITPPSSGITGAYANGGRLTDHVAACEDAIYRTPNFISLDYYEQGSFGGGSFEDYVAAINAAPRLGRAWDEGCTAPHDRADGELCSLDGDCMSSGQCVVGVCDVNYCGDGVLRGGEVCDDGSANSDVAPNACRTSCTRARCGDAVVDIGEGCDEGAANADTEGATCRSSCALATCGDGVLDAGEVCDDGALNAAAGAPCRLTCTRPACGDGVVDTGEACDDGASGSMICDASCSVIVPTLDGGVGDASTPAADAGAPDGSAPDGSATDGGVTGGGVTGGSCAISARGPRSRGGSELAIGLVIALCFVVARRRPAASHGDRVVTAPHAPR